MKRLLALALVAVVVASGCISSGGGGTSTISQNSTNRTLSSLTSWQEATGKDKVIQGVNAFAFELYHKLSQPEGNIFFSPYSLEVALAMAYEGARGAPREEMGQVLHLP
ncbi:MAG: serpin family protein, partial [Thermococcus sp.]|nr:serpin family protein [Thermococcus sp.]